MRCKRGTTGARWLIGLIALGVCLAFGGPAHAQPQYAADCTDCHSMPPLDASDADKDPDSGAVPGNHQKHATSDVNSCAKCHTDVVKSYATGHRNKTIEFNAGLGYDGKRPFLNQTSVPPVPLGGCSTAACHSNGKGVFRTSPSWNSTAPATCDTCHDSTPTSNSHSKHVSVYAYGCAKCHTNHATDAKPFAHATSALNGRAIDVHFTAAPNTGGSFAGNQCLNLYCHSNGKGGAANVIPSWGGSVDCASCHGNATSIGGQALSGKHAKHVNNDAFLGTSYGCQECHAGTVSNNSTIIDATKHVNGGVDFAGAKVGTPVGGSCSTSYCHSDGKGTFRTVAWNQAETLSCNGCHGTGNAFGAPDYASGGAGAVNANSHGKHALAAADCANCHAGTTLTGTSLIAGGSHLNNSIDLQAGNGKSFTPGADKTCSNISCHSGNGIVQNVATAQWGASLNCQGCHSTLSTSHTAHTGIYGCVTCHSDTVVDSVTLKAGGAHMNAAINVAGAKITAFTLADQTCATSCHTGATPPNWTNAASGACGTCHNVTSPLIATNAHTKHFTAVNGPNLPQDVTSCQVCHLYTGERTATHVDGTKNLNAGFNVSGGCSTCHKQASTDWTSAASVTCESCHSTAGGQLSVINSKTAPDKTLAATKGHGSKGQTCQACHDSASAHIGVVGGTKRLNAGLTGASNAECNFCHQDAGKVTTTLGMKAHQASGLGSQCVDCHDPHGTSNQKMVNTTINGTAGVSYTGTSSFVNGGQNGVCQVCHTTTKFFTKAGITPPLTHVDSTTNCLQCHQHNPSTGLAFVPNGSCDTCHGYPPAPRNGTTTFGIQGNWSTARFEDYSGGGGAHTLLAHIDPNIKPSDGWAPCLKCHSGGNDSHQRVLPIRDHVENVSVKVDQQFRFSNKRQLAYSSAVLASGGANKTGSCFNVACHVKKTKKWSTER